jgi:hypothetical protein
LYDFSSGSVNDVDLQIDAQSLTLAVSAPATIALFAIVGFRLKS